MGSRPHKRPCFPFPGSLRPIIGALSNEDTDGFLGQVLARSAGIMTGSVGHFQMVTLLGIDGRSFIAGDSKEAIVEELLGDSAELTGTIYRTYNNLLSILVGCEPNMIQHVCPEAC